MVGFISNRHWWHNLRQNLEVCDDRIVVAVHFEQIGVDFLISDQETHRLQRRKRDVLSREPIASEQRILENSYDRLIFGGTDDLIGYGSKMTQLDFRLRVLRHVQVHFITIKIGIVWFRVTHVHTKCVTLVHNAGDVTHHTHSVQRRLTIKEDGIAVHHMSVHNVAIFQGNQRNVRIS